MGNIDRENASQILIAGGGTAAESLFVAADKTGNLSFLLGTLGVTVVAGRGLRGGELGSYAEARSNSPLGDFLEGLSRDGIYKGVISAFGGRDKGETIPLTEAGWIGDQVGLATETVLRQSLKCKLATGEQVLAVRLTKSPEDGIIFTGLSEGRELSASRFFISATGAYEYSPPGLESYSRKLILSGTVLKGDFIEEIRKLLGEEAGKPEVAVLGSSHSSYAVVRTIRNHFEKEIGVLNIYGRSYPRRFFNSVEEALSSGYTDFDAVRDVCPVTGRVLRFGGNRGYASAETAASLDPASAWSRFVKVDGDFESVKEQLLRAKVVIAGLGYRPNLVPIINEDGAVIGPELDTDGQIKVDGNGRIYFKGGRDLIPGAYAIGLGAGIRPSKTLGGEPGFKGRLDGVNVAWGIVGPAILSDIIERGKWITI